MRMPLLLLVLVLLSGCSVSQLQKSTTALLAADYAQTLEIAKHPDQFWEMNPILGRHPSEDRVHAYFLTWLAINWLVGDRLPERVSKPFYYTMLAVESWAVTNNISAGIRF